ncbi:sugar ABC transporter ATP-binding protein [Baekduia sp. Peel2402]|uniref:sugar ABC transporter ATP-binding protein n=1 Tax=Baekduia sp. Peel2402 TaxID=3458296 RepID=UPI00403EF6E4
MSELLAIDGLTKRFGGIAALQDVSLRLGAGSVLALCGANGAGKSTLVRILAGVETPDAGEIRIDGEPVTIASPQDATRLGMNFIHQELNLVPKFTALQNMALGYEGAARRGLLDRRAARRRAKEVVGRLGADFDLDAPVQDLTVSQRWMVSLGRSLMREGARVIAMDEPTASFTEAEAERLFSIISDLTAGGVAVLYISHRLDEVLHVSHDVTVLRNGKLVGTFAAGEIDRARLTREIVGQEVAELEAIPTSEQPLEARPVVLSARDLAREPRVRGVSLDVHAGEILGVAGLVGAGRTEVARLLFGADAPTSGTMELDGKAYAPRSPYDAIRRGVALVPEERRSEGLLLQESVAFNISLATAKENRRGGLGLLSPGRARATAREMVSRFGIKVASVDQPVGSLSGGNQQKVVVSKYVRAGPKLLILDEPTVGVDVGARGELYAIIRDLAEAGAAVIVISSDFEELAFCERVAVMREGRVTAMVDAAHATKDHLTSLCYSEEAAA